MGFLSVILSGVEESQFSILNVCHRFGGNGKRFLDFARNDKFKCRAPLGCIPDKMRMSFLAVMSSGAETSLTV